MTVKLPGKDFQGANALCFISGSGAIHAFNQIRKLEDSKRNIPLASVITDVKKQRREKVEKKSKQYGNSWSKNYYNSWSNRSQTGGHKVSSKNWENPNAKTDIKSTAAKQPATKEASKLDERAALMARIAQLEAQKKERLQRKSAHESGASGESQGDSKRQRVA